LGSISLNLGNKFILYEWRGRAWIGLDWPGLAWKGIARQGFIYEKEAKHC